MSKSRVAALLVAGGAAVLAIVALCVLVPAQKDWTVLILVGPLNGDQLAVLSWALLGAAVAWLIAQGAGGLRRAGGVARTWLAGSLYVLTIVAAVLGIPWLLWMGMWASLDDRVQVSASDGRGVVIDTTSFLSASYSVYVGSGFVYRQIPGGLDGASADMPPMIAKDFALDESGPKLVLVYAAERGGALVNRLVIG